MFNDLITETEFTQKLCATQKSKWSLRSGPLNGSKFNMVKCATEGVQVLSVDYWLHDYQCEQEFINVQVQEGAAVKIPSGCSAWIEDIGVNNKIEKQKLCPANTRLYRPRRKLSNGSLVSDIFSLETSECDMTGLNSATTSLGGQDHFCKQEYSDLEFAGKSFRVPFGCSLYLHA